MSPKAFVAVGLAVLTALLWIVSSARSASAQSACGGSAIDTYHQPQCDASGGLIPWTIDESGPFHHIMSIEARWWLNAPPVNGWPTYLTAAKLTRDYSASGGALPGSTASMAIEAYLKYYAYTGDAAYLSMVRTIGDYILQQGLTPDDYAVYPRFPWPVGETGDITPDGGGHAFNTAGHIMPDKGAMVGIALLHLYEATGDIAYRDEAVHIANVLAATAVPGTATESPWPFRSDGNTGAFVDGRVSGNQVFALRLFDELIRLGIAGNGSYQSCRDNVWNWLKNVAIADTSGDKWLHFFEDHSGDEYNPTQIDALEMERYLLEQKDALDPDWFAMAGSLINLVKRRWVVHSGDYTAIGEQQSDLTPYNSHTARYASILAMYFEAGGPSAYREEAFSSFAYSTYSVDVDGFADTYFNEGIAWSTDSFGDWMMHFADGLGAIPEWAPWNSDHLLKSSSVVRTIVYRASAISYLTFDASGRETLKVKFRPTSVLVDGSAISSWNWDSLTHVLVVDRANGTAVEISGEGVPPDFVLSVTPEKQSVMVGSSTAYTVRITGIAGFGAAVNMSVTGLPRGMTATFVPSLVTRSGSSTLNLVADSTAPIGSYTLTIAASADNLSHAATAALELMPPTATVTFDNLTPPNRVLSGQYPTGLVDWGTGTSWYLSEPWGLFTTQSISFVSSGQASASFSLMPSAALIRFQAYNGGPARSAVTASCDRQPDVQAVLEAGTMATIDTGWDGPCSPVTLEAGNGWATNFDNLIISTASTPPAPLPGFTVAVTPVSRTVVRGDSISYRAKVSAVSGFSGVTSLSVTGLPAKATGTFSPAAVRGSGSSTLKVTTRPATRAGSYTLTITGSSGTLTHRATVIFVVRSAHPRHHRSRMVDRSARTTRVRSTDAGVTSIQTGFGPAL
jgi:hypothetical protein